MSPVNRTNIRSLSIPMGNCAGRRGKLTGILYFVLSVNGCPRNIWKRCAHWLFRGLPPGAMELLHEHFGVERLAIVGGGHICGGFLEAGLIDEVSIMVAPGIDGRKGQTAVFDGISRMECNPYKLKLESVEQWETDIVWLRYKIK